MSLSWTLILLTLTLSPAQSIFVKPQTKVLIWLHTQNLHVTWYAPLVCNTSSGRSSILATVSLSSPHIQKWISSALGRYFCGSLLYSAPMWVGRGESITLTLQLSDTLTLWHSDTLNLWHSNSPTLQLSDCLTVWLSESLTVWLSDCLTLQLSDCLTLQLFNFLTV